MFIVNFESPRSNFAQELSRERAEAAMSERGHPVISALRSTSLEPVWAGLREELARNPSDDFFCTEAVKRFEPELLRTLDEAKEGGRAFELRPEDLVSIWSHVLGDKSLPNSEYLRYRLAM